MVLELLRPDPKTYMVLSVPKSGTYFLSEIIKQASGGRARVVFLTAAFANDGEDKTLSFTQKDMKRYGRMTRFPRIFQCHWEYHQCLLDFINEQGWIPAFIYRNPFDVAVSFVDGGLAGKFGDIVIAELRKTADKNARYKLYVRGIPGVNHPNADGLKRIYQLRMPWVEHVPSFRYEDLIGPDRGGNEYTEATLNKLIDLTQTDSDTVVRAIEKAKTVNTKTKLKATTGEWNRRVSNTVVRFFIRELDELNTNLGYTR